jgi:hypothetical protein
MKTPPFPWTVEMKGQLENWKGWHSLIKELGFDRVAKDSMEKNINQNCSYLSV